MTQLTLLKYDDLDASVLCLDDKEPTSLDWDTLQTAVNQGVGGGLVIDLQMVKVINSALLEDFIRLGLQLRNAGKVLVLLNCNRHVLETMEPLPRRLRLDPGSCPMFLASDHAEAVRWIELFGTM